LTTNPNLAELFRDWSDARTKYEIALKEALDMQMEDSEPNAQRLIPHTTLIATIEFLREVGVEERLRAPLLHLLAALDDANHGRSNEILTPSAYIDGTSKTKTHAAAEWAMAAAAVTILSNAEGWTTGKALDHVSKALKCNPRKLAEHRKNLTRRPSGQKSGAKRRAPSDSVAAYLDWLKTRARFSDLTSFDFVEIMMDKARRLALKTRA
jgi:hypothetical protein